MSLKYTKEQIAFFKEKGKKGGHNSWASLSDDEKDLRIRNLTEKRLSKIAKRKALKAQKDL